MDDFTITIDPSWGDPCGNEYLAVYVQINGQYVHSSGHILDVDTFFAAMSSRNSKVTFLGPCGIPECCGSSKVTRIESAAWYWGISSGLNPPDGESFLRWTDVLRAADQIIAEAEKLPEDHCEYQYYQEHLDYYRQKRDELKMSIIRDSERVFET